tara:strand:+ start:698 stop:1255 length:558 start_codon:yes stop_codon:yes gene_type:complete
MAKRRKDIKVKNTDGITRVKPIKNVGTDPETGKKIQNIVVKRADGAVITTRYADGEKVGETTSYSKVLKKKKPKKLRVKKKRIPRKLKPVKVPEDIANFKPTVKLDEDAKKEVERREDVKKKKEEQEKRIAERKKGKTKKKVKRVVRKVKDKVKDTTRKVKKVFKRRPKARKVKNLVTGGTNILR